MAGKFFILAVALSMIHYPLIMDNSPGDQTPAAQSHQALPPDFSAEDQPRGVDTSDKKGLQDVIRRLTSPELEHRKKSRREFQQRHYAEILYELAMMDAPGALLASVRSQAQLELQLPGTPLTVTVPIKQPPPPPPGMPGFTGQPSPPMVITLFEDRRFPSDPWSDR